jgi:hypothetical protein
MINAELAIPAPIVQDRPSILVIYAIPVRDRARQSPPP